MYKATLSKSKACKSSLLFRFHLSNKGHWVLIRKPKASCKKQQKTTTWSTNINTHILLYFLPHWRLHSDVVMVCESPVRSVNQLQLIASPQGACFDHTPCRPGSVTNQAHRCDKTEVTCNPTHCAYANQNHADNHSVYDRSTFSNARQFIVLARAETFVCFMLYVHALQWCNIQQYVTIKATFHSNYSF